MTSRRRILAIIPARAGSTGIPGKNIRNFCGKPLIAHTIETAREADIFDRIVVSTDSEEIAGIARANGAETPYLRPAEFATATASVADAVIHMLDYLRAVDGYTPDLFFLLQATSPLRDARDITRSLDVFDRGDATGLVSVCPTHHETFEIQSGILHVRNGQRTAHVNRQELPPTYRQDGSMIYIHRADDFRRRPEFAADGMLAYVIPKWKAVDLDEMEDWTLGEVLYQNRWAFEQ